MAVNDSGHGYHQVQSAAEAFAELQYIGGQPAAVLDQFEEFYPRFQVQALTNELVGLLRDHPDADSLAAAVGRLADYAAPSGYDYRNYLLATLRLLRERGCTVPDLPGLND